MPDIDSAMQIWGEMQGGADAGAPTPTALPIDDFAAKMQIGQMAVDGKLPKIKEPAKEQEPGYFEDLGKTLVGSTIPRAAAGLAMIGPNMYNMGVDTAKWIGKKIDPDIALLQPTGGPDERGKLFSSEDVLQGATKAAGLPAPYDSKYAMNRFIDTVGQFALGGKMAGAANAEMAMTNPKLMMSSLGGATGATIAPDNPLAPILGGMAGGEIHSGATKIVEPMTQAGREQALIQETQKAAGASPEEFSRQIQGLADQTKTLGENIPSLEEYQQKHIGQAFEDKNQAQIGMINQAKEARQAAATKYGESISSGDPNDIAPAITSHIDALTKEQTALEHAQEVLADQIKGGAPAEQIGGKMFGAIRDKVTAIKEHYNSLWDKLSPLDDVSLPTSKPLQDAVNNNVREVAKYADTIGERLHPEEVPIYQAINKWVSTERERPTSFGDLRRLNKVINDAIAKVGKTDGFGTAAVVRLRQVRDAIVPTMEANLSQLTPEQAKLVSMPLAEELGNYYGQGKESAAIAAGGNRTVAQNARVGSENVSGMGGATGAQGGKLPIAAGNKGIPPKSPIETYQQYKQERTDFGKTYTEKGSPFKDIVETQRGTPEAKVPVSSIPGRFFYKGAESGGDIKAYKAAGYDMEPIAEHALNEVNRIATDPQTGKIAPRRLAKFMSDHDSALSEMPELKQQLSDLRKAQEALDTAKGRNIAAQKEVNKTQAARLLGAGEIKQGIANIFSGKETLKNASKAVELLKGSPEALDGLKRATIEHAMDKPIEWIQQNRQALKKILGGQQLQALERVMNEKMTAEKYLGKPKPQGRSSVMSNLGEEMGKHPFLGGAAVVGAMEHLAGPLIEAAKSHPIFSGIAGAGTLLAALRKAGINKLNDLRIEAILNPDKLAELYRKYPQAADLPPPVLKRIARNIGQISIPTVTSNATNGKQRKM